VGDMTTEEKRAVLEAMGYTFVRSRRLARWVCYEPSAEFPEDWVVIAPEEETTVEEVVVEAWREVGCGHAPNR
jgi:hypothetical protein